MIIRSVGISWRAQDFVLGGQKGPKPPPRTEGAEAPPPSSEPWPVGAPSFDTSASYKIIIHFT